MAKVALLALALLIAAPLASAHATVETDDGAYFLTVGHRSEPTATFLRSGLDLIITENDNGQRGPEVPDLADKLEATLISPSGDEFSQPLSLQHGATGRYSFGDPYVLTEPGQYMLRLKGTIGSTAVDGTYKVSGPLADIGDLGFPRTDVSDPVELQSQIAALATRIAELEAQAAEPRTSEGAPGLGPLALMAGLVGLVAIMRRR